MDCLFCDIANKKKDAEIIFEDDALVAFHDINPKTRLHVLVIPKTHIESINDVGVSEEAVMGKLFSAIPKIAEKLGVKNSGYRLQINVGRGGGQIIDHLHVHLLAD